MDDLKTLPIFAEIKKVYLQDQDFYKEIYKKCDSHAAHMAVYSNLSYKSLMLRSLFELLADESPIPDGYSDLAYLKRSAKDYRNTVKEITDLYFHDGNLLEKEVKEKIILLAKRSILRQWIKRNWHTFRRIVCRYLNNLLETE